MVIYMKTKERLKCLINKSPANFAIDTSNLQKCVDKQKQTIEAQAKEIGQLKEERTDLMNQHIQEGTMHRETIDRLIEENKELKKWRLKLSMRAVDEGRTFERDLIE